MIDFGFEFREIWGKKVPLRCDERDNVGSSSGTLVQFQFPGEGFSEIIACFLNIITTRREEKSE